MLLGPSYAMDFLGPRPVPHVTLRFRERSFHIRDFALAWRRTDARDEPARGRKAASLWRGVPTACRDR